MEICSRNGLHPILHASNSAAALHIPEAQFDMVRGGIAMYGCHPAGHSVKGIDLRPVMSWHAYLTHVKTIPAGEGVSYDYLWKAAEDSVIATLPFGYADGYPRNLRDKGYVIIRGQKAPLVGVLCMDQCMADVTDIPGVSTGDEAVIYGDGSDGSMTIEEASKLAGTNKNDIIARITARPPRVYTE